MKLSRSRIQTLTSNFVIIGAFDKPIFRMFLSGLLEWIIAERNAEGKAAKENLNEHHIKVEKTVDSNQTDFTSSTLPNSTAVIVDLQKVFALPKLTHSSVYYAARQLLCYNFGIYKSPTSPLWFLSTRVLLEEELIKCQLTAACFQQQW